MKELGQNLRELIQGFEAPSQVSDKLASLAREFTERIGHESQSLRDEVRRRSDDTRDTLERMFAELSNVNAGREAVWCIDHGAVGHSRS